MRSVQAGTGLNAGDHPDAFRPPQPATVTAACRV
jgi:hypothetical protein